MLPAGQLTLTRLLPRQRPCATPSPRAAAGGRPVRAARAQPHHHDHHHQQHHHQQQQQEEGKAAAPAYPYNAGEGERRQKATIEHIFGDVEAAEEAAAISDRGSNGRGASTSSSSSLQAPWALGWQMSERNLVWNDDLKMRLIRRVASEQLGISEAELDARLQEVYCLLPDLRARLAQAPADMVVRLAARTREIAGRLLRIKAAFPRADAGAMVANRLGLLLDPEAELPDFERAAARLRQLVPGLDTDRFAEAFPAVLDVDDFEAALEDTKRLIPNMDVPGMLRANPDMVLSLMKGKHLIVYDPPEDVRGTE